ncbi:hypothetical protein D3C81_802470 [compost metagenome]
MRADLDKARHFGQESMNIYFNPRIITIVNNLSHDGKQLKLGAKNNGSVRNVSFDKITMNKIKEQIEKTEADKAQAGNL